MKPLGRIVSWATVGVEPTLMGMGPAPAIRKALERAKLIARDIDLIEINEAFAPQYLACEKELGLDRESQRQRRRDRARPPARRQRRAAGPDAAARARRRGKKYGVASACIGGGQGIAMIVEAL